jgi:hypothetical protein
MKTRKSTWMYAAGAAVACAGIIGVSTLAANAGTRPGAPLAFGAGGASADPSAPSAATPTPAESASAPAPADPGSGDDGASTPPDGDVVPTGIKNWVLYAVAIKEKALPKTHFGLMAGTRAADGKLTGVVETNETSGSDRSPGFHAIEGTMNVNNQDSPTFGYYSGPATKITGKVGGKIVTAGEATWSKDSSIHFFWFAPKATVTKLAAYDKNGHRLPAGHSGIGVG